MRARAVPNVVNDRDGYSRCEVPAEIALARSETRTMAKSILIVEDEQDLVSTLEYNLEREGFETQSALNGSDGICASPSPSPTPDLVLLDLMLPGCLGHRGLPTDPRKPGHWPDIPVIMLTAKGEEIDRVVGFEVGADDYVVKPFSVRELILTH